MSGLCSHPVLLLLGLPGQFPFKVAPLKYKLGFPLLTPALGQVWGPRDPPYLDGSPGLLLTAYKVLKETGPILCSLKWALGVQTKGSHFHKELGAQASVSATNVSA